MADGMRVSEISAATGINTKLLSDLCKSGYVTAVKHQTGVGALGYEWRITMPVAEVLDVFRVQHPLAYQMLSRGLKKSRRSPEEMRKDVNFDSADLWSLKEISDKIKIDVKRLSSWMQRNAEASETFRTPKGLMFTKAAAYRAAHSYRMRLDQPSTPESATTPPVVPVVTWGIMSARFQSLESQMTSLLDRMATIEELLKALNEKWS